MDEGKMEPVIRWKRILEVTEKIVNRDVVFYLTSKHTGYRGALIHDDEGKTIIYMDLLTNKSEEDVIETISHEAAHLLMGTSDHSLEWSEKMKEVRKKFKEEMGQGRKNKQ